ncbi:UNVERIFIED_CONTAM: hypothetical protein Sradi_6141500, partial [Sesamum radiatum]
IMSTGAPPPPRRGHHGQGCGRGRGRGPPSPHRAESEDPAPATPSSEAVSQPPILIPADTGVVGSMRRGPAVHRSRLGRGMHHHHQRLYFPHRPKGIRSASRMRGMTIPQEHQLFWFQKLKVRKWWDYDDESMFKVVKSQAGKFLWKRFANAPTSWPDRLWLAEEIWRQLLEFWASPEFQT